MKNRKPRAEKAPSAASVSEPVPLPAAGPNALSQVEPFFEKFGVWIAILLVAIATARIVSTYWEFSFTSDEPAHVGAGMEWIEKHEYIYEPQHPPLTRVMTALLPRLAGAHAWNEPEMTQEGLHVLWGNGNPDTMLALARAGMLPFFWLLCWVVYAATRWIARARTPAVLAVFLLTMIPTVLAHAGLATTDIGLTATFMLSVYTLWRWVDDPTWKRAVIAGMALASTVVSKFSTLAFMPVTAGAGLALWWFFEYSSSEGLGDRVKKLIPQTVVAGLVAAVLIWATYWFSFGRTVQFSFSVPAPEFFYGLQQVQDHNTTGHRAYLLGEIRDTGWFYFYPLALAIKTPLAILGLGLLGLGMMLKKGHRTDGTFLAPGITLGIMAFVCFFSRIQIGTRHIMPVYAALAMGGGCALYWLLPTLSRKSWGMPVTILAILLSAGPSVLAHPDYIPYFNFLAGSRPDKIMADSDLDWGQDVKRVAKRLRQLGAQSASYNQLFPGNLTELYGFPPYRPVEAAGPSPGWNVVGPTPLRIGRFGARLVVEYPKGYEFWPDKLKPVEQVGTHWLYYIPPR